MMVLVAHRRTRRRAAPEETTWSFGPLSRWEVIVAVAAGALIAGHWSTAINGALHGGMLGPDTLAYHGPIAALFSQSGSIVDPPRVYGDPAVAFYPGNSELFHAVLIDLFARDVMSPLVNVGWLALSLLAAWCIGRPTGRAGLTVVLVAAVIDLPVFSTSQPGSGDNDTMALAMMLSSLALALHAVQVRRSGFYRQERGIVLALAGLAGGLAVGTKLAFLGPLGLMTLAVMLAVDGKRERLSWMLSLIAGCGFWFIRNLIAFGSPVPAVKLGIGPVALPAAILPRSHAVSEFIGNGRYWRGVLLPGLHWAFTFLWPAVLGIAAAGAVLASFRGRSRLERLLGPVVLLEAIAYLFTPRTADGLFFQFNLRYLVPAVLTGIVLLVRNMPGLPRAWVAVACVPALAAVVLDITEGPRFATVASLSAIVIFAGALVLVRFSRRIPRRALVTLGAAGAGLLLLWPVERTYLATRYVSGALTGCELGPCTPLRFAAFLHGARIAVAGGLGPYPLFGDDLSNRTVDVETHGRHGTSSPIDSCRAWRDALRLGRFRYVVISPAYYLYPIVTSVREAAWTRSDPSAVTLSVTPTLFGGTISTFKLVRPPNSAACSQPTAAFTPSGGVARG
ncbi:MAG: hypothetical protein M3Z06_16155 [Actinomycetota bacterium]|nr:hypothetical protein [Actinomycetota bacterium]